MVALVESAKHRNPGLVWVTFKTLSAIELTDIAARLQCGSVALLGNAPGPGIGRTVGTNEVAALRSMFAASGMIMSSLDIQQASSDRCH